MIEDDKLDKLERLKTQISDAFDLAEEMRDSANEDIRFCNVDGGMWEGWLEDTHGFNTNRAKLEFDITTDYVNRYVGEWTLNRAAVNFVPDDDATTDDDAELLNGIYRADFKDNDGQIAEDNAIQETAECGCGHFLLKTRFQDEDDPENDNQDIYWEPLYNSYNTVIWDTQAKRSDKADAKWCCVLVTYTHDSFEETFPDASPASAYTPASRRMLDWVTKDEIYVANLYRVHRQRETLRVYENIDLEEIRATSDPEQEKQLKAEGWTFVRERKINRQEIRKSVFTSVEFIEDDKRIPGRLIPVIPMYGFRKYIDGQERYRGLVRKLKDANRLFNSSVSRLAEASASSGDEIPILTDKQVEGLEGNWADKTTKAYQIINTLEDANGNDIPAGPVGYLKPPAIDPNTAASAQIVTEFVQRATGNMSQDQIDPDASGVAIDRWQRIQNLNTQVMTDNILQAKKHSGKVYLSIAEEIYADRLRTKRTISLDGAAQLTKINTLSVDDKKGVPKLSNTITGHKFKVDVEIGPQYESQREATVETLERAMKLVGPDSQYFQPLMAMWLKNISGTGLDEVKEFNRREMLKMGLTEPETEEEMQLMQALSQQEDPTVTLQLAAAKQQEAEAASMAASAQQKLADAQKKKAETVEILEGIGKPIANAGR